MPPIKLTKLISVNSENEKSQAANLLLPAGSGKTWKTEKAGVEKAVAIFQLKEPSTINGVDVGNNGSAFVEVSVGTEASDDWKVLLYASSLMTPADARSSQNLLKVRMFKDDELAKPLLQKSWDRVKIVCSQPFNKSVTYGLSFISFLTEDKSKEDEPFASKPVAQSENSQDQMTYKKGSLFEQRKRLQAFEPPVTAAEAVRALTRKADEEMGTSRPSSSISSSGKPPSSVKRPSRDSKSHDPPADKKRIASLPSSVSSPTSSANKVPNSSSSSKSSESKQKAEPKPRRRASTENGEEKVPLKEILKGVIFSLSGYKNPKRGDLRDKGLAMGAKFKPDWNKSCTHLICAFENTPKYDQADGQGYILKDGWILDQHKFQKKLSWRKYRLGRAKTPPLDMKSDDSSAPSHTTKPQAKAHIASPTPADKPKQSDEVPRKRKAKASNPVYDDSTDEDEPVVKKPTKPDSDPDFTPTQPLSDESDDDKTEVDSIDTDDEIEAHLAGKSSPVKGKAPANGSTPRIKSSVQPPSPGTLSSTPLPKLPDYLKGKVFFLYGTVDGRRNIFRYIHAYGGEVEEYMCDSVKFVITDDKWDDNFDSALNDNPDLIFVKSEWILNTHSRQKALPYQKYAITPI